MSLTGVPNIPFTTLTRLSQAISRGQFSYAMLQAEASALGLGVGEFVWGITAQRGATGVVASLARQIWSAIKLLTEFPQIRVAVNAARLAAAALPVAIEQSAQSGALAVAGQTATSIGTAIGLEGTAATVVGGGLGVAGLALVGWLIYSAGAAMFGVAEAEDGTAVTNNTTVPHACGNPEIAHDANWSWYQRIYGGGNSVSFEKSGYICGNRSYWTYRDGAMTGYTCDGDWLNCKRSEKPSSLIVKVTHGEGYTSYYYDDGNAWGSRVPQ